MKNSLKLALVLGLFAFSACNYTTTGTTDPYYAAWYNVVGQPCSYSYAMPSPGCNYYAYGGKIMAWQDPFSYQWQRNGQYWMSPSGIWYDPSGYAINSDPSNNEASADVITQAANQADLIVKDAGKALAQQYALSEESGVHIAKSLQDWAVLGKDRTRTASDIADFSTRLYGVSAVKVGAALTQASATRSLKPLEELNVDVAAHWGTSPEVSKTILKKWYQNELSNFAQ
jgi:hypothetical protein